MREAVHGFSRVYESLPELDFCRSLCLSFDPAEILEYGAAVFSNCNFRRFFFHTIWEAKSQYIYPYFIMLLPCAAAGISDVCGVMEEKIRIPAGGWRRKQDEK